MKVKNTTIHNCKDILKFWIFFESFLITIEPGERCTNICISTEEGIKYVSMITCKLRINVRIEHGKIVLCNIDFQSDSSDF